MSREALEALMDRWMNDPAFREALRADPATTVREIGVELTEDEWSALRRMVDSLDGGQLQPRISI